MTEQLISNKMFVILLFLPALPILPIVGYMEYMLNFDEDVNKFRTECESKGMDFTFDIPKILMCDEIDVAEIPRLEYVGEIPWK